MEAGKNLLHKTGKLMKKLILIFSAFACLSAGAQTIESEWQMELAQLESRIEWTDAQLDRMDSLRSAESVAECVLRLSQNGYAHVYDMIEEAQGQYGSPLFFGLFGREGRFVSGFDAEMKIKTRYPVWAKARGLSGGNN